MVVLAMVVMLGVARGGMIAVVGILPLMGRLILMLHIQTP
jgi:hypothetical protein